MPKVYLVGAGPGDPNLLTLGALRVLERAEVVIYDRLVSAEVLALANPDARLIYAGKLQGQQEAIQAGIHELLLHYAARVEVVVRLKGGDPLVFGRGAEEWSFLRRHGIAVEVIPGVSSAIAVPALCGVPLTYRGVARSFAVIAGHRQNLLAEDWAAYRHVDTVVVLMGVANRELIAEQLIAGGRPPDQPVAFLVRGTTDRENVVNATLAEVAAGTVEVESPAIFVIGEVVRLRDQLIPAVAESLEAIG